MARILVLGSGMVGSAMALDLAAAHEVLATDREAAALRRLEGKSGITTMLLDAADEAALRAAVADMDLVVSAVPGFLGYATLRILIEAGKNVADISFFPEESLDLDALAKEKGVVVVTDIGVAPGLHNIIFGWHDTRMEIHKYTCMVGGIPKQRDFPWEYKAPFSPADVIEEYLRPSRLVEGGKVVVKPALSEPEPVEFAEVGTLEAFNTDGLRTLIRTMPHVPDMSEKTLRYPGHRDLALALRESGFLSEQPVSVGGKQVIPREVTSAVLFDQWKLGPEEEELTVMRITVEGLEDGKQVRHVWHLHDVYDAATCTSSMARTTGYTCTAMAEMVLSGEWDTPGVAPGEIVGRKQGVFEQVRAYLEDRGVVLQHEVC